jgi:hypothetical protein
MTCEKSQTMHKVCTKKSEYENLDEIVHEIIFFTEMNFKNKFKFLIIY